MTRLLEARRSAEVPPESQHVVVDPELVVISDEDRREGGA
jgi:hypothetical protein